MDSFCVKEIGTLDFEHVKKEIFPNHQYLKLKDAQVGHQPDNTVIIGCFQQVVRRKNVEKDNQLLKCTFKEVFRNGDENFFDTYFYPEYIPTLEKCLLKTEPNETWFAFSNILISKFNGIKKPWADFNLKVISVNNVIPLVTIMHQSKVLKNITYKTLKHVKHGVRLNVFVVVKEILKPMKTLKNGSKHIMFALIDPSCLEEDSVRSDLPLHIFLNDPKDKIPEEIKVGDILRLREMLGELFQTEKRMFGKIFNSAALTKFNINEDSGEVVPVSSSDYILTDQDKEKVIALSDWWKQVKPTLDLNEADPTGENGIVPSESADSVLRLQLSDIKGPMVFHLSCFIKEICNLEKCEAILVRVTDGTKCPNFTSIINFESATQDIESGTENVQFNPPEIDVLIEEPHLKKAKQLKVGMYVLLEHVDCCDSTTLSNGYKVLEFFLKRKESKIHILATNTSLVRKIQRRFAGIMNTPEQEKEKEEEQQDQEEQQEEQQQEQVQIENKKPSSCPSQDVDKESDSLSRSQNENDAIENGVDGEEATTQTESECPIGVEESPPTPVSADQSSPVGPSTGCSEIRPGHNSSSDAPLISNSKKPHVIIGRSSLSSSLSRSSPCKRKCQLVVSFSETDKKQKVSAEDGKEAPVRQRILYKWNPKSVYGECEPHPKCSLSDFINGSRNGDCRRVWALLHHIHFLSCNPYQNCTCITCFHDWVWGMCTECGTLLDSSELRDTYPSQDLRWETYLPCLNPSCPSKSSTSEDKVATVQPFMKLELCLEDICSEKDFVVDLNGDGAEEFFGIASSFRWTVDPADAALSQIGSVICHRSPSLPPVQLCLKNVLKSDNTTSFLVCDTRLRIRNH